MIQKKEYFDQQIVVIKILNALFPDATIYLFGSRARGDNTEQSDIDLAIDTGKIERTLEIDTAKEVLHGLPIVNTIDIVDFQRIPEYLKKTITKEGVILWKK
ncbi:MAG: nucleotidyltransferase domain-containing protein [Candidatus Babeliales bacterium]